MRKTHIRENKGLILNKKSSAKDGTWDIWCVSPQGFDLNGDGKIDYSEWKCGTAFFRKLKRFGKNNKNKDGQKIKILGPWSAKELQRRYDTEVDCILFTEVPDETEIVDGEVNVLSYRFVKSDGIRTPWCYFGESPERLAEVDYVPSNSDITNDVEIDRDDLFIPAELVEIGEIEKPKGIVR